MKSWQERLKQVKTVITHDNCMDGLASAMLIKEALPHAEIRFLSHNSKELAALEPTAGMLFCDFAPPREKLGLFLEAEALVLDHHKHAKDIVMPFVERGLGFFADEVTEHGVSGAVLAYRHVWYETFDKHWDGTDDEDAFEGRSYAGDFAALAGIRDTWFRSHKRWEQALDLHATLSAFPREHWLGAPLTQTAMTKALFAAEHIGGELRKRHDAAVQRVAERGVICRKAPSGLVWGLSCADLALVSDLGEATRARGVNVLVNVTNGIDSRLLWRVSLRSDGSVDVGALASRFGGGGHSRAAGFQCPQDARTLLDFVSGLADSVG